MQKNLAKLISTTIIASAIAIVGISAPTYRTTTLSLIGHQYDGTVISDIIIHDTGGDGIVLRDVNNITIKNCEIYNVSEGIAFSSLGNTSNVVIENCNIHDTGRNGIIIKQHVGYNQTNVSIKNNKITNTGTSSTSGAYHGIYMQATDNVIIGNTIDVSTGNGVSIRSSGTVSGNKISNTAKSCVRYFSDNIVGVSKRLLVENNLCVNPAPDYPALSILWGANPAVVTTFDIRFNTLIGGLSAFQVQSSQFSTAQVSFYGNLFNKPFSPTYVDYQVGNLQSALPLNSDYSLPSGHPAIGFSSSVRDFPTIDINGAQRISIDAGAFTYTSSVVTPSTQVPPTNTFTVSPSQTPSPTRTSTANPTITPTRTVTPTVTQTVSPIPTTQVPTLVCYPVLVGDKYIGEFCP